MISGTATVVVPWPFKLVPLLFLVGSLEILVGRFVVPRRRRCRTLYAVTDRRVISLVRRKWLADRATDMYLTAIPRIAIHQGLSSRGALLFGDAPPYDELRLFAQMMDEKLKTGVGFYNIEDPETVKTLVEACRQHASVQSALETGGSATTNDSLREHS